jgi:hypothetical protein
MAVDIRKRPPARFPPGDQDRFEAHVLQSEPAELGGDEPLRPDVGLVGRSVAPDGDHLAFLHKGDLYLADINGQYAACVETGLSLTGGARWRPAS